MPAEQRRLYAWWSRPDDARRDRTRRGDTPADLLEPIGEQRSEAEHFRSDRIDVDLQQQLDRRSRAIDAVGVQRSGFESPRIGEEIDFAFEKAAVAVDARPAVL